VDFCKLKTTDSALVSSLFFDVPSFKELIVNHTFMIDSITVPRDEKDPVKMREKAIRAGKIVRTIIVDGKTQVNEFPFSN
jgi:hypothetical protein